MLGTPEMFLHVLSRNGATDSGKKKKNQAGVKRRLDTSKTLVRIAKMSFCPGNILTPQTESKARAIV